AGGHGEGDDLARATVALDLADALDAAQARHGQVDHRHVRLELRRELHRGLAILGFGYDLNVAHRLEAQPYALANDRVVIGEQDANHGLATGTLIRTRSPRGGTGVATKSPTSSRARSRMPNMPRC